MTTVYLVLHGTSGDPGRVADIIAAASSERSAKDLAGRHHERLRVDTNERLAAIRACVSSLPPGRTYMFYSDPKSPSLREIEAAPLAWERIERPWSRSGDGSSALRARTTLGDDDSYLIVPVAVDGDG